MAVCVCIASKQDPGTPRDRASKPQHTSNFFKLIIHILHTEKWAAVWLNSFWLKKKSVRDQHVKLPVLRWSSHYSNLSYTFALQAVGFINVNESIEASVLLRIYTSFNIFKSSEELHTITAANCNTLVKLQSFTCTCGGYSVIKLDFLSWFSQWIYHKGKFVFALRI